MGGKAAWVSRLLEQAGISETEKEVCKEITGILPDTFQGQVCLVDGYVLVIEVRDDICYHELRNKEKVLILYNNESKKYAVNAAVLCGQRIASETEYKKVIVMGVSGNEKSHRITPVYCDETPMYLELPETESFISFNKNNIGDYYMKEIIQKKTDREKETEEILREAAMLHQNLYTYGKLKTQDKPLVVAGILLALQGMEYQCFDLEDLTGDSEKTDGMKIYEAIEKELECAEIYPHAKRDKLLGQFSIIRDSAILSEVNVTLEKTPLRHYTEFLYENIYQPFKNTNSAEDYLGRFYAEFMSYGGGDGQTLGIILTPKHITELFTELLNIRADDVIFDPCAGTAGFLIAGMQKQFQEVINAKGLCTRKEIDTDEEIQHIRQYQLHGYELQPYMFTIATINMILRGDGKSNLRNLDFLAQNPAEIRNTIRPTVGMMNPPYAQGSSKNPELYEMNFVKRLLDSMVLGGRAAVIVPISSMTGKTKEIKALKKEIMKRHTLEGVITLNADTFYGVDTHPVIAVFTAHTPHPVSKVCKFINFENDGFEVSPHIGLIETESAKDRKEHLLDVWNDRLEADTGFCVKSTVTNEDEWLHSFFYFCDEVPPESIFENTASEYLSFQFEMIMKGKQYLFEQEKNSPAYREEKSLKECRWKAFKIGDVFHVSGTKTIQPKDLIPDGTTPRITCSSVRNGLDDTYRNEPTETGGVLTVDSAAVGVVTYQPFDFIASDHIEKIALQGKRMNLFVGEFLAAMIMFCTGNKYKYGYKFSKFRIKRQMIMLPVDASGNVDYKYMEQYMKNVMSRKIKEYMDFYQNNQVECYEKK